MITGAASRNHQLARIRCFGKKRDCIVIEVDCRFLVVTFPRLLSNSTSRLGRAPVGGYTFFSNGTLDAFDLAGAVDGVAIFRSHQNLRRLAFG
jgi:hypothetical protein